MQQQHKISHLPVFNVPGLTVTKGGPCVCACWLNFNQQYGSHPRSAVLLRCKMVTSPPMRFKGTLKKENIAGLF